MSLHTNWWHVPLESKLSRMRQTVDKLIKQCQGAPQRQAYQTAVLLGEILNMLDDIAEHIKIVDRSGILDVAEPLKALIKK